MSKLSCLFATFAVMAVLSEDKATAARLGRAIRPGYCGTSIVEPKRQSFNRIVGGSDATPHSLPFMISLHKDYVGWHHCGGSLIKTNNEEQSNIVVTAAHCFNRPANGRMVVAGVHEQSNIGSGTQTSKVKKVLIHEKFNKRTFENDIAVLVLEKPLKFNDRVQPICLPSRGQDLATNTDVTVSGWGDRREDAGEIAPVLQQVTVNTIDYENCANNLVPLGYTVDKKMMICAGDNRGGRDSCQGDSGGPLFTGDGNNNRYILWGVVSFGDGCARENLPGVYTKVSNYVDWLQTQVDTHGV